MSTMEALAEELLAQPRQKVNNLPKLIANLSSLDESVASTVHSLRLFFLGAFERGELSSRSPEPAKQHQQQQQQQAPKAVFASWLHRQYSAYLSALLALLSGAPGARVQVAALGALMECVRGEEAGGFNNRLFVQVVEVAVRGAGVQPEVLGALLSKYMGYADVRYYTLRAIDSIATKHAAHDSGKPTGGEESDEDSELGAPAAGGFVSAHDLARNLHDILAQAPLFEGEGGTELESWCGAAEVGAVAPANDANGSRQRKKRKLQQQEGAAAPGQQQRAKWASARLQKKALSDAWLAFLRLSLPDDTYKRVLTRLHDLVVPAIFNPLLLSDFLTHSLDRGGLIGMLALNGIFILVTQHALEYPQFYTRLYGLLTPDLFQAKHRARFLQLADIFLASPMVPAYTAASFAKKFARLALTASPAGALIALAFIHNIVRRHPSCQQMLHRPPLGVAGGSATEGPTTQGGADEAASGGALAPPVFAGEDVFDAAEPDPAKSRAIESSLWELEALRRHSNPTVASFSGSLDKDLSDRRKTAEIDIGEMLGASYTSMFTTEAERRIKGVPTAFYQRAPTRLFDANCVADLPGWEL